MASESIIKLNVGGQLFQTTKQTLTKYPDSMLSTMFKHTEKGLAPMPKTEEDHYFLDANPEFFKIILDWLRLDEITTNDYSLLKGTMALANYFGLRKLMDKLEAVGCP